MVCLWPQGFLHIYIKTMNKTMNACNDKAYKHWGVGFLFFLTSSINDIINFFYSKFFLNLLFSFH